MDTRNEQSTQNVTVTSGRIIIENLELLDEDLATYLGEFPQQIRADIIKRAVKIGLLALKSSATVEKVDYVEKEFFKLGKKLSDDLDKFGRELKEALNNVFDEDGGIMKNALEKYLGTGGKLEDLFDPQRKDSAISKISCILDDHFKGPDSEVFKLLNHDNPESPIASLKRHLIENYLQGIRDKIVGEEAAEAERRKGTAKGRSYEVNVLSKINEICAPFQDIPEYTADISGNIAKNKVGDIVVKINPLYTVGASLKIVIEAKDRGDYNAQKIQKELETAKENRDACVGLAVFTSDTCPLECYPLQQYGDDKLVCIYDPDDADCLALNLAYRVSRIAALGKLRGAPQQIDGEKMKMLLRRCSEKLGMISSIKRKVTQLSTDVNSDLDKLKADLESLFDKLDASVQQPVIQ